MRYNWHRINWANLKCTIWKSLYIYLCRYIFVKYICMYIFMKALHVHHPKSFFCPLIIPTLAASCPTNTQETTDPFVAMIVCIFYNFYMSGIIQYVFFVFAWLLSRTYYLTHSYFKIYPCCCRYYSFIFFHCWSIPLYGYATVYWFTNCGVVSCKVAVTNEAAMNICVLVFLCAYAYISLGWISRSRTVGRCLTFQELQNSASKVFYLLHSQ